MKTLIIAFTFLVVCSSCAQDPHNSFIEVTGSAEMTVIPDDIELEIVLAHPGNTKNSVEVLDKKFFDALEAHKMPKSAVSFVSVDNPYYWYCWWWEYRHYNNSKTYKIKLDCKKHDFAFINDIKPDYIRSIRIASSTHSQIAEYRRQLKMEAMKAAKEKASDLLECIGQKAGKVFEVVELQEPDANNYWFNGYNVNSYTSNAYFQQPLSGADASDQPHVPSIKLRFEIKAKFEII